MGSFDPTRAPLPLSGAVHKPLNDPFQESPDPHLLFPSSQGTVGSPGTATGQVPGGRGVGSLAQLSMGEKGTPLAACGCSANPVLEESSRDLTLGAIIPASPGANEASDASSPPFIHPLTHPSTLSFLPLALGSPDSAQGSLLVVLGMHRASQAEPTLNQPFEPLLSLPFLSCTGVPGKASSSTTLIVLTHSRSSCCRAPAVPSMARH